MKVALSRPVLIGLTVSGISAAYMLYLLLRKDEDEMDTHGQQDQNSCSVCAEIKILQDNVGAVIGRGGSTVKEIEGNTNTRITFKSDLSDAACRLCIIQGNQEGVQLAKSLIHNVLVNLPLIERCEMFVPQQVHGFNSAVRSISLTSKAKIIVQGSGDYTSGKFRRLIIKGTSEQIALAKLLIEEKVMENINVQEKIQERLDRSPHKRMGPQYLMPVEAFEVEQGKRHSTECLVVTGKDRFLKVFVSALAHPGRFWVQVVGPRAVELDHLVEKMTEFYKQEANRKCHALKEVIVDQIVAAPFSHDDNWYRARVTDLMLDDYDVEESLVTVYYLDYGGLDIQRKKDLCSLQVKFLKLRYQAIECSLAKVKPVEGRWSDEAIELFSDLCLVARWRVLMSRVVSYKVCGHGEHEGSPVPAVELYDTNGTQDICVAEELVKKGYATWEGNPAVDQQRNVVTQLRQLPTDSKGAASSSMKSDTVVGVSEEQAVMESCDFRKRKSEA